MSKLSDKDKVKVIDDIHYLFRTNENLYITKNDLCEFLLSQSTIHNLGKYYRMIYED